MVRVQELTGRFQPFSRRRGHDESVKLPESCLCDTIEVVPGVTSVDPEQLERSLARHFTAMHRLREALGLPEDLCEDVAEGIIGMFRNSAVERIEGDAYR
ncbi:MAG: hypothetical protein V5B44_07325 [Candidatus Accumulibacter necessarius]|uniref:hypothetical protein n=1 Tax=Candidatus Accumulibacter necessarius TaxID=2954386 RepID=UPI002FC30810